MRSMAMCSLALNACGRIGFVEVGISDGALDGGRDSRDGAGTSDGVRLTFEHNAGYDWSTAGVTQDPALMTFQWQSTSYAAGGHGSVYGDFVVDDVFTTVMRSLVELTPHSDLAQVTEAACSALTYDDTYTRISDGQIACVKRLPQGDHAAVLLVSHTDDAESNSALAATLHVKTL